MKTDTKIQEHPEVDRGLVAMFLKMTPDERLRTNDNSVRAILELRNAYRKWTNPHELHRSESSN